MSREVHVPFYERLGVQFPRPTHRFALSFRDVEDVLARRSVEVTYEAIRKWCRRFGPEYAGRLRRRRGRLGDTWHLDEVFVTLQGRQQYLWRAVDEAGDVLDILVLSSARSGSRLSCSRCSAPRSPLLACALFGYWVRAS